MTDDIKTDIESRKDIEMLVNAFYEKIKSDEILGPVFTLKIPVNWQTHLPIMYQFWENAIFFAGDYIGNPMLVHKHIHKKIGLDKQQFDHWVALFNQTVAELFEGKNANLARQRACSIAELMKHKILTKSGE